MKNTVILIFSICLFLASCNPDGSTYVASNDNSVGSNAGKNQLDPQCCTPFTMDLCGAGDVTYVPADIIGFLIAQGATHNDPALTPFASTDIIHEIDVDLKGVDGEGQCWDGAAFVTTVAEKCDAIYGLNGGQTNLDPGGSRDNDGGNKGPTLSNGYNLPNQFDFIEVKDLSIVTVTGEICQDSQLLNQG